MATQVDLPRLEALHAEATRFYSSGRIELTHDDETARRWAVVAFEAFPDLLAELKELREKVQMTVDYNTALRAERDRLRAEAVAEGAVRTQLRGELAAANDANAGLREEVSWAMKYFETCGQLGAAERLRAALARTPAQHRDRIVAAGLREMAEKVKAMMEAGASTYAAARNTALADVVIALSKEAERLERGE